MPKHVFVNFVSDPANDHMKSIVGLACAARAVSEGHDVSVFFAAAGVRLLESDFIDILDKEMASDVPMVRSFMESLLDGAKLYCSFGSVKAVLGYEEGDNALIVPDDNIVWSGPPGVIELTVTSDSQLVY